MKTLKDASQPLSLLMPLKLLILHGEAKPCCFTVSCVLEIMFNNIIVSSFRVISLVSTCYK